LEQELMVRAAGVDKVKRTYLFHEAAEMEMSL
jgi:hypothetical protein